MVTLMGFKWSTSINMKTLVFLMLFLSVNCGSVYKPNEFLLRYTGIQCYSSNKTLIDVWCNVKAYSRTVTVLNNGFTFIRPIYKVYLNMALDYKYGTIYREVIRVKNVELCSIVNGTSSNYIVNTVMDILRGSMPDSMHPCPYFGKHETFNITMDSTKFPSIFPSGTYRGRLHYYDDIDPNISTFLTYTTCKSTIKTSF